MIQTAMLIVAQEQFIDAYRAGETATLPVPCQIAEFRPRKILVEVATAHGITTAEMRAPGRRHWTARQEAAKRLREELSLSYPKIGQFLNRSHHPVYNMIHDGYRLDRNRKIKESRHGKTG
jgi:chromosomal replication initiation ATPase DnaA